MAKYELIALLPLTGTDEEMKAMGGKIEERLKTSGGTIFGSMAILKGRLPYAILKQKQGYHHLIQFEMEEQGLVEFRRALTLSGDTLRFDVKRVAGEFKKFVATAPRVSPSRQTRVSSHAAPIAVRHAPTVPVSTPTLLSQETVKTEETKKVSMEEIDKRLEEILGDK
ncbi:MAG: 30S ribosomal protein S6 [bacterium]|nr:30S ribosomal protein S6 [bacterium]